MPYGFWVTLFVYLQEISIPCVNRYVITYAFYRRLTKIVANKVTKLTQFSEDRNSLSVLKNCVRH